MVSGKAADALFANPRLRLELRTRTVEMREESTPVGPHPCVRRFESASVSGVASECVELYRFERPDDRPAATRAVVHHPVDVLGRSHLVLGRVMAGPGRHATSEHLRGNDVHRFPSDVDDTVDLVFGDDEGG